MVDQAILELDKPYCNEISEGIFLGSIHAVELMPSFVQTLGAVVSLVNEEKCPRASISRYLPDGCDHLYINIRDNRQADMRPHFGRGAAFIQFHVKRGHRVLVHCMSGISRSATLLTYYYMKQRGLGPLEALLFIKERRCIVFPNRSFLDQLFEVN